MLLPPGLLALSPAVYLLPTVRRARCSCTFPIRLRLFLFSFLSFQCGRHFPHFPGFMRRSPPPIRKSPLFVRKLHLLGEESMVIWMLFGFSNGGSQQNEAPRQNKFCVFIKYCQSICSFILIKTFQKEKRRPSKTSYLSRCLMHIGVVGVPDTKDPRLCIR